jgi:hypothetical protein
LECFGPNGVNAGTLARFVLHQVQLGGPVAGGGNGVRRLVQAEQGDRGVIAGGGVDREVDEIL